MAMNKIADTDAPYDGLSALLEVIHREGPSGSNHLESLSYYKRFHPEVFSRLEEEVVSALGLFYKNKNPNNIYSFLMSGFGQEHKATYGSLLTPVQASIRRAVDESQYVSISAPTSAGKSYSIRDFIAEQEGDAVVVVPSRALIAEYVNTMRRKFEGDKNVMISPFVDRVFTSRSLRRIFVLTPERSKDLYSMADQLNIEVFFFDEAQVSEDKERGVIFDVMVRRVRRNFPSAKLIFAHPFVDNPDAQFTKHGIQSVNRFSKSYDQGAVGKIAVYRHKNKKDYYFSPHQEKGHLLKNCVEFSGSFKDFALNGEHTVLVYVSKASIYKGTFIDGFKKYVDKYENISESDALRIIEDIESVLGSDSEDHISDMVDLLRKGVVIHHGSVPLEVRFLLEDFIRGGFARICFATSTLAQGVNMPFDVVWLENSRIIGNDEEDRSLSFKNLIGRSGRLSEDNIFDYGFVYTKNAKIFSERINCGYSLREESLIDCTDVEDDIGGGSEDVEELLGAIRNNTFDEELNLPKTKVERLTDDGVLDAAGAFLDIIYAEDSIRDSIGGEEHRDDRDEALSSLRAIYEASIGRSLLTGESAVFSTAISIFFLVIQGYSFREIAGLRYSRISNRDGGRVGNAKFTQPANKLPDSSLKNAYSLFGLNTRAKAVRFDAIIYDTYDYLDTVLSFSLVEVFSAAFQIYFESSEDSRATKMIELLRYGTNDLTNILLMRYGFPPEEVPDLAKYVEEISEDNISFNELLEHAPRYIKDFVEWYLP